MAPVLCPRWLHIDGWSAGQPFATPQPLVLQIAYIVTVHQMEPPLSALTQITTVQGSFWTKIPFHELVRLMESAE